MNSTAEYSLITLVVIAIVFHLVIGILAIKWCIQTYQNRLLKIRLGMTREQVISVMGRPDNMGGTSRKYPTPKVYLYGRLEFGFGPNRDDGLVYVMDASMHEMIIGA